MAGETVDPIEMIRRLVAFDTTSERSNLELVAYVQDYLAGHGVTASLVPNPAGTKANLIATLGPDRPGGVVLSGHTDVVPVAGQAWDSDPFAVVARRDRLHGRGTADMKSFIAVALALVPEFLAAGLRVPIHLALSYDEEVGCLGAVPLLERLAEILPTPSAAIVGEPSAMRAVNAHRGIAAFATTVTGRPGHASATHRGVSAIAYAAECVAFLNRLAAELKDRGPAESDLDPPFTTVNVGRITGGSAVNVIAPTCRIEWEVRPMPGTDAEDVKARLDAFVEGELLPTMRSVAPEAGITTEPTVSVPPFLPRPGSPAEALALALTGQNRCTTVPFASEAGLFQAAGIDAVICGPGSPDQAHRANEHVRVDDVAACAAFMRRLARWAAEGDRIQ